MEALEAALPAGAWPNYVLGNHDEPRLATRFGAGPSRVAAMLLLTLRGVPTLYYGDELGLPQLDVPPERQQDPPGRRLPGRGRDGCRTPMPWDGGPNGGFCPPGVTPWLPPGPAAPRRPVAGQLQDPHSLLNLYRSLLALCLGDYRAIPGAPDGCFAYRRSHPGARSLTVALSFTPAARWVEGLPPGRVVAFTALSREGEATAGHLRLGPDEGVVVEEGAGG